jgi:hypothetical protein
MSLNWPIHAVAQSERFWTDYFWETAPDPHPRYHALLNLEQPVPADMLAIVRECRLELPEKIASCRLDIPVGAGYGLGLDFPSHFSDVDLSLLLPDAQRSELAEDNLSHWHPHVLRWEELDLICKCAAIQDATLPHPGLPLLLLYRFAPITECDNVDRIFPLLRDAWRSLRLFDEEQINKFVQRVDKRGSKFEWRFEDSLGWALHQDTRPEGKATLYTFRSRPRASASASFPFAEYGRMVEEAQAMCAGLLRPEWIQANNGAVRRVAVEIDTTKDFTHLPILADALEDAGCDVTMVLTHCRQQVPLRAGSWVVDTILDKPWTIEPTVN